MSQSQPSGGSEPGSTVPVASESPGPVLDIEDTGYGRRTIRLEREITRVGRRTDNDIQVVEPHVSKHHADIVRKGEQYVVVDAGSKAGVLVNGRLVTERSLADGDVITLGAMPSPALTFRSGAPSAMAAAREPMLSTLTGRLADQSLENLARFLEFNRVLGRRLPLEEILENVVDLAIRLTMAERGFLILKLPDGSLDFRVARTRAGLPIPRDAIRVSETIVREALVGGAARIIADVRMDESLAIMNSVAALELGSAVALPLCDLNLRGEGAPSAVPGGGAFGVLYLDSHERRGALTRTDRGILETLARDASSVIENARLLREAEENRRIEDEMKRAREVQAALLPQEFWGNAHFEAWGSCVPSLRLGGDYLDQFRLGGQRCGFVMADVSGKGLPAALLAAALQGATAVESATDQPPGAMAERINRALCRLAPEGTFVTFFCCVLSPAGELRYVNAGHPPSLVLTGNGELRKLATGDMALGLRESTRYHEGSVTLHQGDLLVLYTDGVTEAPDSRGRLFDESGLERVLRDTARLPAVRIVEAILGAVQTFTGNAPPRDDISLMVVKYLGS